MFLGKSVNGLIKQSRGIGGRVKEGEVEREREGGREEERGDFYSGAIP